MAMEIQSKTYTLSPEWRRIPYYLLACLMLVVVIVMITDRYIPLDTTNEPGSLERLTICGIMFLVWLLFARWIWSWRLRVDSQGVHWRNIYWRSWTWEVFQSGEVSREKALVFIWNSARFDRNKLSLVYIQDKERKEILETIERFWFPFVPEYREALELNVAKGPSKRMRLMFSESGIESDYAGRIHCYRWDDVTGIKVTKFLHRQQGFKELLIALSDEEIVFKNEGERINWTGATQIELLDFIQRMVPEENIVGVALDEIMFPEDIDEQIAFLQKSQKKSRLVSICMPFLGLGLLLWIGPGILKLIHEIKNSPALIGWLLAILALLHAVAFIAFFLALPLMHVYTQKRINELREKKESFRTL